MNLTTHQLAILRNMLGISDTRRPFPRPYRDYYCAGHANEDLAALEAAGAVRKRGENDRYVTYATTPEGRDAALLSFIKIRLAEEEAKYTTSVFQPQTGEVRP